MHPAPLAENPVRRRLLNCVRVETADVEMLIQKSFYTFQQQAALPQLQARHQQLMRRLGSAELTLPNLEIATELNATIYAEAALRDELRTIVNLPIHALPFMQVGGGAVVECSCRWRVGLLGVVHAGAGGVWGGVGGRADCGHFGNGKEFLDLTPGHLLNPPLDVGRRLAASCKCARPCRLVPRLVDSPSAMISVGASSSISNARLPMARLQSAPPRPRKGARAAAGVVEWQAAPSRST